MLLEMYFKFCSVKITHQSISIARMDKYMCLGMGQTAQMLQKYLKVEQINFLPTHVENLSICRSQSYLLGPFLNALTHM